MENQLPVKPPVVTVPSVVEQPKSNNFLVVLLSLLLFLAVAVAGFFAYRTQQLVKELTLLKLEPIVTVQPTIEPVATFSSTSTPETYIDPQSRFTFQYPGSWKIISKIPDNFLYHDYSGRSDWQSYINSQEGLNWWLAGKMFVGNCRGPILQNINNLSEIIALETVSADGDGGFCWSIGYFMNDNKWKVSENYMYPMTQDNSGSLQTPEWRGDFFKFQTLGQSTKYKVFAGLANRETYIFKGEDVLNQILSSFKFVN